MKEIKNASLPTGASFTASTRIISMHNDETDTQERTPEHKSESLPETLAQEGLTVMQQLQESGKYLLESMDEVREKPNYSIADVVSLANALSETAQVQANLLKVFKKLR